MPNWFSVESFPRKYRHPAKSALALNCSLLFEILKMFLFCSSSVATSVEAWVRLDMR